MTGQTINHSLNTHEGDQVIGTGGNQAADNKTRADFKIKQEAQDMTQDRQETLEHITGHLTQKLDTENSEPNQA